MDSKIGLLFQLNGVFLITVLSLWLGRSLKLTSLKYWSVAWLCLSFALICLRLAFSYDILGSLLFTYYFLGEYLFGLLLFAGCRALDGRWQLRPRSELVMAPFLLLAIVLPLLTFDFNDTYAIHTLVLSGFFTASFVALRRSPQRNFGWKVTNIALMGLAIDFMAYSVIYGLNELSVYNSRFLEFSPAIDLVLETALGFGMVSILLENVLWETKSAHERLQQANRRLEELVHTDPLTAAFSRHAFYGFVKKHGDENTETAGCVGFFDIDNLKEINDRFGHGAGDHAIRAVVRAIRDIVRAEDLIFRWGGDEFFVIMIGMDAEMAIDRMARLESLLTETFVDEIPDPVTLGVSWGFTDFNDISMLEEAINKADAEMYSRKLQKKQRGEGTTKTIPLFAEPKPGLSA